MTAESQLVAALVAKQQESDLTDLEMAQKLGVSRELWNKTRLGQKRIRARMLHGIIKAFPELTTECLDFLRRNGTKVANLDTKGPEARLTA